MHDYEKENVVKFVYLPCFFNYMFATFDQYYTNFYLVSIWFLYLSSSKYA